MDLTSCHYSLVTGVTDRDGFFQNFQLVSHARKRFGKKHHTRHNPSRDDKTMGFYEPDNGIELSGPRVAQDARILAAGQHEVDCSTVGRMVTAWLQALRK